VWNGLAPFPLLSNAAANFGRLNTTNLCISAVLPEQNFSCVSLKARNDCIIHTFLILCAYGQKTEIGGGGDACPILPIVQSLPALPCHEVAPLNTAGRSGVCCKLPVWAQAEPGRQTRFCALRVKNCFWL